MLFKRVSLNQNAALLQEFAGKNMIYKTRKNFLVVGAGFSGAVLARALAANLDAHVTVIDERHHIGGNCYTERDPSTGIMLHVYGPHIFNTNRRDVWDYVSRFSTMRAYTNRVKAVTSRGIFSMPINLHTINQFFGRAFSPNEAKIFLSAQGDKSIGEPANFEEQALKMLGRELYEVFFYGYTKKQWGCEPAELPASILKRLPVRFNYDDNYYDSIYQGIPAEGYATMIMNILNHEHISIECLRPYDSSMRYEYDHVFYTGPIDRFFLGSEGPLGYRTVTFERIDAVGDFQGNAVLNYPDLEYRYTRIHEHKHFAPWESHGSTVCFREYSKETTEEDTPYYPKRLNKDLAILTQYRELALGLDGVSFLGRLATYRYLNMDQAIGEAIDFARQVIEAINAKNALPVFPGSL